VREHLPITQIHREPMRRKYQYLSDEPTLTVNNF
jgi:hypothetical protein